MKRQEILALLYLHFVLLIVLIVACYLNLSSKQSKGIAAASVQQQIDAGNIRRQISVIMERLNNEPPVKTARMK